MADDECFPIPLNVQELFQQTFGDVDFDGSGQIEANGRDGITPLMFHLSLNPNLGITTRLLRSSTPHAGSGTAPVIFSELEVGLSNLTLSIFEEGLEGEKLSWCHQNFALSDLSACQREAHKRPIAQFHLSGKLTYKVLLTTSPDRHGEYELAFGLINREGATTPDADPERSYFKLSLLENNTLYADEELLDSINVIFHSAVRPMAFGNQQTVSIKIPQQLIQRLREEEDPDLDDLIDTLHDFNIDEIELQTPVMQFSPTEPRSLSLGLDLEFLYLD
ncbi:MAG: hypothetical protein Q7S00_02115 [bacterium]|nr:hypothetical protein [bacterium]